MTFPTSIREGDCADTIRRSKEKQTHKPLVRRG